MALPFWKPGDHVVWRSRLYGSVGYVMLVTVVVDTSEVTVLFQAPGSICKKPTGQRGGPRGRSMLIGGWNGGHEDLVWRGPPNLRLHVWGTSHAIIRSWNFTRDCAESWYVNLESAWRRTPIGFDSQDLVLDVTVAADLSSWAWKDEDELAWSVDVGKYSPEQAEAIRAEGLRVVQALETRAWPFTSDWSAWRPNPLWAIPSVPEDWADESL